MKPFLPKNYPHGLVYYDEYDVLLRESLVKLITSQIKTILRTINPSIKFIQVETPTLTPASYLQSHIDTGFELIKTDKLYLRPETTRGTFEALKLIYPQQAQMRKALPICIWQAGKSYRNEQTRPFGELRFKEFYQLEYQLIYPESTKVDYFNYVVTELSTYLSSLFNSNISIELQVKLPHYSLQTTDLYLEDIEVVGVSKRKDFDFPVLEVACGLDRLTYLFKERR